MIAVAINITEESRPLLKPQGKPDWSFKMRQNPVKNTTEQAQEFYEKIITINRVSKVTKGGKKYIGSGGSISATNPSTGRTTQIPVSFSPSAGKQEVRPESMFSGTQTMMDRFKKFTGGKSKQKFQYGASNVESSQVGTGSRPGQVQFGAFGASKIVSERGTKKRQSGFSDYLTEKLNVMASKSADTKRSDLKVKRSSSKKKYKK